MLTKSTKLTTHFIDKKKNVASLTECRVSSEQDTSRTVRKFWSTAKNDTSTHSNFRKNNVVNVILKQMLEQKRFHEYLTVENHVVTENSVITIMDNTQNERLNLENTYYEGTN